MFKNFKDYDATGLMELVTKGEVHPKEIVEAAIERIEEIESRIKCRCPYYVRPGFKRS